MTTLNLPTVPLARWTPKRKAAIVSAIRHHALTYAAARRRYGIDQAEIEVWGVLLAQGGTLALRATRCAFCM
jgi:hypothetical protein